MNNGDMRAQVRTAQAFLLCAIIFIGSQAKWSSMSDVELVGTSVGLALVAGVAFIVQSLYPR